MNDLQERARVQLLIGLWYCHICKAWWSSQPAEAPETWLLARMVALIPRPVEPLDQHPVWTVAGPDPSVCPECGSKMCQREMKGHVF